MASNELTLGATTSMAIFLLFLVTIITLSSRDAAEAFTVVGCNNGYGSLSISNEHGPPPASSFFRRNPSDSAFVVSRRPFKVSFPASQRRSRGGSASLHMAGYGVADKYSWNEEPFEIDVTVKVPVDTRAKDIIYKATSRSIDLRLKGRNGSEETVLLDPARKLRGRVNLDGTYWVISDSEAADKKGFREVTVTIEKLLRTPTDDFEVVEYDWKGVYEDEVEHNDTIVERKYKEPEALNVREYAAGLGVDIDNINMSLVDKTMFSSGMNLTQSSLSELEKAGLVKQVTRQADGAEFTVNEEGVPEQFSALGETVSKDEFDQATQQQGESKPKIPFLDTDSPWQKQAVQTGANVVQGVDPQTNQTVVQQTRNFTRAAFANAAAENDKTEVIDAKDASDPVDLLTVKRLKEILKSQGLKVSGNKKELKERLRQHVNSLMQGKQ